MNEKVCQYIPKKVGDVCANHSVCRQFDPNSECKYGLCHCNEGLKFDLIDNMCKSHPFRYITFDCPKGYIFNEFETMCRPIIKNQSRGYGVLIQILVCFAVVMILVLTIGYKFIRYGIWLSERDSRETANRYRSLLSDRLRQSSVPIDRLDPIYVNSSAPIHENEPPPYPDELPTYEEALSVRTVRM